MLISGLGHCMYYCLRNYYCYIQETIILTEKIDAPFISCISKINNVLIGNAEDLNIVLPMYNLIEYCKNYRNTTGSLWNYYRDESNYPPADNYSADPITNSKFFEYKTSIIGST